MNCPKCNGTMIERPLFTSVYHECPVCDSPEPVTPTADSDVLPDWNCTENQFRKMWQLGVDYGMKPDKLRAMWRVKTGRFSGKTAQPQSMPRYSPTEAQKQWHAVHANPQPHVYKLPEGGYYTICTWYPDGKVVTKKVYIKD